MYVRSNLTQVNLRHLILMNTIIYRGIWFICTHTMLIQIWFNQLNMKILFYFNVKMEGKRSYFTRWVSVGNWLHSWWRLVEARWLTVSLPHSLSHSLIRHTLRILFLVIYFNSYVLYSVMLTLRNIAVICRYFHYELLMSVLHMH